MIRYRGATTLLLVACVALAAPAAAQTARARYEAALAREATVRAQLDLADDPSTAERTRILREVTRVVAGYEGVVRRFPTSGYCDNALWQGAGLAEAAYRRFGRADDRGKAVQLYNWLAREYPASGLARRARTQVAGLERAQSVEASLTTAGTEPEPAPRPAPTPAVSVPVMRAADTGAPPAIGSATRATLTAIDRTVLPEAVRVTLSLDREVAYHEERIANPDRLFFDLRGAQLAEPLVDAVLAFPDDAIPQIRTGRHPNGTVRVVLDLRDVSRYSVFTLYNPFRLVVDFERTAAARAARAALATPPPPTGDASAGGPAVPPDATPAPAVLAGRASTSGPSASPATAVADSPAAPAAPLSNGAGSFSLSRQLGLGVSRIVIDPGHGGHDPGASAHGIRESELTLDLALRLEKLLAGEPGVEVVLTRRTNVYVPLEERTAIANREGADLFLSIHANASRNTAARGVETYYLSFASTPDAEAVAARENSASERSMNSLPDIIKAIALNNKLDESRDLAGMVQEAMVTRLRRANKDVRNLGVKKAPFVVLIGAGMPSVLAEVSFLTHRQEAQLLKSSAYKQRIAEALHAAVMKYRGALKRQTTIADRDQF